MTAVNVLRGPLAVCYFDPLTGFLQNDWCQTDKQDYRTYGGLRVTGTFLAYSLNRSDAGTTEAERCLNVF